MPFNLNCASVGEIMYVCLAVERFDELAGVWRRVVCGCGESWSVDGDQVVDRRLVGNGTAFHLAICRLLGHWMCAAGKDCVWTGRNTVLFPVR